MPELAAIYFLGFLASLVLGSIFGINQRAKYHSKSYLLLQKNLKLLNLRWNDLNLSVETFKDEHQQAKEYQKARLTSFSIILVGMLLSWLGLLFLVVIWTSLKLIGNSQLEKNIYASSLTESELTPDEVKNQLAILKLNVFR